MSPEEVARLLQAAGSLKVSGIDSKRRVIRVEQGKDRDLHWIFNNDDNL